MSYYGDYASAATMNFKFTSVDANGKPTTLTSFAAVTYRDATTASTSAGVTATSNFNSVVGLNAITIVASDAYYSTGADFAIVLTAGTAAATDLTGYVVAEFSIENRDTNWAKLRGAAAANTLSNTIVQTVNAIFTGAITAASFSAAAIDAAAIAANAIGAAEVSSGAITATAIAANAINAAAFSDACITEAKFAAGAIGTAAFSQIAANLVWSTGASVMPELGQAQPVATPVPRDALALLYMALRNRLTVDATTLTVNNDAGTVIAKATVSDDGTTFTRTKFTTGP